MKHRIQSIVLSRLGIATALFTIGGILLFAFWPPREPSYAGKSLGYWLRQDFWSIRVGKGPSPEAEDAVRKIGTNALPTLIQMLRARDSRLKLALMKWSAKQSLINFQFNSSWERRSQGQVGYLILGPAAAQQVPELIQILAHDNLPGARQGSADALGRIGPQSKPAASVLLHAATDQDKLVRNNSLIALTTIDAEPALVVPALIHGLDDPWFPIREHAARALPRYTPMATNAVSALIRTAPTNKAAYTALLQIDPNAASRIKVP